MIFFLQWLILIIVRVVSTNNGIVNFFREMHPANIPVLQGTFFAISLQDHKVLGSTLVAHIVKLMSSDGGIYTVVDNIFPENTIKWRQYVPEPVVKIVKLIDETSDSQLYKTLGKEKKSLALFYEAVQKDETFGNYVRSYYERRLAKCLDFIVKENIPVFLRDKKFNNLYHDNLLIVDSSIAQPIFRFEVTANETHYALCANSNGKRIYFKHRNAKVISNDPCIILLGSYVTRLSGIDGKKITPFFNKDYIAIPKTSERKYFETFVTNAVRNHRVEAVGFTIDDQARVPKAVLSIETMLNGSIGILLYFFYGNKKYLCNSKPQSEVQLTSENGAYRFVRFRRDDAWEENINVLLKGVGLINIQGAEFAPEGSNTEYQIIEWINRNEKAIHALGVGISQEVKGATYYLKHFNLDIKARFNNDWFDIFGMVKLNDFEFPFILLRKNILKGIKEYTLPNGEIFIIPDEWFARFKPLFAVGRNDGECLKMNRSSFGFIHDAEIECPEVDFIKNRFENISLAQQVDIPKNLKAQLRGYQKIGLLWMQMLNESGLGGCLADDMGLGKTVQTLAALQYDIEMRRDNGSSKAIDGIIQMGHTSLLVVPTSLIFNWQREIKRFTPDLSVYQFTGPNRTRSVSKLVKYDIVLTTYGVLRNEIDLLKDVRFNYIVLDESQTIKNPSSKVYRSAMLLKGKHFLTLSGTPIENSLSDLWAQINFLNRGMLGSLKTFREEYIQPIERNDDKQVERLKEVIKPFILRRSKHEVAPELPALNEQVVYCNLGDGQKTIYEEEKSTIRNQIIENIENLGYKNSSISILRGLTRLRQIANHPKMLEEYGSSDSGKFDEIARTIETLVEENHKILVFSSFVKHLRIVEDHLKKLGVGYQMLIGSSTNRQQIVDSFQTDSSTNVFLISIKAGGVGLNLTAADYILVLDPWWNPAVENQAIARAHRIGQDKSVFVYRFISVDTVEEKIQRLQEQKLLLSKEFVENANPLSALGEKQVVDMFS